MTIHEVSEKYGISPDTLRYYEKVGMIPPVTRVRGIRNYTPEDIIEEHWDENDVDVMRFHCTEILEANAYAPERKLEQDIILMSNSEEGWVVRLCGEIGMDELVRVAKNLEIRETGNVLTYDDFESHYTFMDGGVG